MSSCWGQPVIQRAYNVQVARYVVGLQAEIVEMATELVDPEVTKVLAIRGRKPDQVRRHDCGSAAPRHGVRSGSAPRDPKVVY